MGRLGLAFVLVITGCSGKTPEGGQGAKTDPSATGSNARATASAQPQSAGAGKPQSSPIRTDPNSVLKIDTPELQAKFDQLDEPMKKEILNMAASIDGMPAGPVFSMRPVTEHKEFFDKSKLYLHLIKVADRKGFQQLKEHITYKLGKTDNARLAFAVLSPDECTRAINIAGEMRFTALKDLPSESQQFVNSHKVVFGMD